MTKFNGIPLIKIPKNIPNYNFLEGDFGKEVLNEYNSTVNSEFKDNSNLKVLSFKDERVRGSNIPSDILMNRLLFKYGLRTVSPSDAQKVIDNNDKFLKGVYVDLGVVLRTEDGENQYLAGQLAKQSKDRKYKFSNSNPLVFKSSDLELIADNDSPYGLGFKIRESATPFNALELSSKNEGKKFNTTNKNGVPIFYKNGSRTNYATDNGLSGFSLDWISDLYSKYVSLAGSNVSGRIVVIDERGKK